MLPYSERECFRNLAAEPGNDPELDYFFSHAYHDMRFFLKSITKSNSSIYTYFGDMQRDFFYISDNMRDTFGFESNLVHNLFEKWRTRIHGDKWREMFDRNRENMLAAKKDYHDMRYQVVDKNGRVFWIRCYGSLQWNKDKTIPLFFSGRIARQDENFTVDPVTNFPTGDTLQLKLADIKESGESCMAIGFSLNNISQINTLYGRSIVDHMIGDISRNLMDSFAGRLFFYRLSGIRCVALVESCVTESKDELVEQIREIIHEGYINLGLAVENPCSFAVMNYPQDKLSPLDFQDNMVMLIKLACSDPKLPYIENSRQNLKRIQEMSNMQMAITQDVLNGMKNFRAVVQPVVCTETGRIISGETLMRWNYRGEDISPNVFIPLLEKGRTIHIAGRWIIEQAVKLCAWLVKYQPDIYLSVNISLNQLRDEELLLFIRDTLNKYNLDGSHLVLELTESSMDKEPTRLNMLIDMCSKLGVRLALDDFGTGYSSLRVLLKYNTNIIKLDRSLLLEMTESEDKSNFISSIVFACHQFGKKVCIEGVETDTQRKLARDANCDLIQGFYFYRPTELKDIYDMVEGK